MADTERTEAAAEPCRHYLPGMGHDLLLPLYDSVQKVFGVPGVHRGLLGHADIRPGGHVLEIGCGTGNLAILVKRSHPDADVVGIDPDPKALTRARRKAEREALSVRLDRGYAQELPYPDGAFDRVLSALMLHHLGAAEKEPALREARRVVAPGGSLCLLDFGGEKAPSDGFVARRAHRSRMLQDNFGDGIPTLMRKAGFADAAEIDHRVTRRLGRLTYYRATAARG